MAFPLRVRRDPATRTARRQRGPGGPRQGERRSSVACGVASRQAGGRAAASSRWVATRMAPGPSSVSAAKTGSPRAAQDHDGVATPRRQRRRRRGSGAPRQRRHADRPAGDIPPDAARRERPAREMRRDARLVLRRDHHQRPAPPPARPVRRQSLLREGSVSPRHDGPGGRRDGSSPSRAITAKARAASCGRCEAPGVSRMGQAGRSRAERRGWRPPANAAGAASRISTCAARR